MLWKLAHALSDPYVCLFNSLGSEGFGGSFLAGIAEEEVAFFGEAGAAPSSFFLVVLGRLGAGIALTTRSMVLMEEPRGWACWDWKPP